MQSYAPMPYGAAMPMPGGVYQSGMGMMPQVQRTGMMTPVAYATAPTQMMSAPMIAAAPTYSTASMVNTPVMTTPMASTANIMAPPPAFEVPTASALALGPAGPMGVIPTNYTSGNGRAFPGTNPYTYNPKCHACDEYCLTMCNCCRGSGVPSGPRRGGCC